MKYFNYNQDAICTVVSKQKVVKNLTPIALSEEEIRSRLSALKENKALFKKLILSFEELENVEKINLLSNFYYKNFLGLKYFLIDELKKNYPVERMVPSKLTFVSKDNNEVGKCDIKVLTKQGVKFIPFKSYSKEELEQLIKDEKIAVIGYDVVKKVSAKGEDVEDFVFTYCPEFDEIEVAEITKHSKVMKELIKDISLEEIKVDYELLYLPAYKSGLKFLEGCAKAANEFEVQKRRKLQKEAQESNEKSKKFAEINKILADTAKGR